MTFFAITDSEGFSNQALHMGIIYTFRQSTNLLISAVTLTFLFASGCATTHIGRVDTNLQTISPGMIVSPVPIGLGYYAEVEKLGGKWHIVGDLSKKIIYRSSADHEVLFVSRSLKSVAPVFQEKDMINELTICTPFIQDEKKYRYGLCNSKFSTVLPAISTARTFASCLLTLCFGYNTTVFLDHDKVIEAALESGLIVDVLSLQ